MKRWRSPEGAYVGVVTKRGRKWLHFVAIAHGGVRLFKLPLTEERFIADLGDTQPGDRYVAKRLLAVGRGRLGFYHQRAREALLAYLEEPTDGEATPPRIAR